MCAWLGAVVSESRTSELFPSARPQRSHSEKYSDGEHRPCHFQHLSPNRSRFLVVREKLSVRCFFLHRSERPGDSQADQTSQKRENPTKHNELFGGTPSPAQLMDVFCLLLLDLFQVDSSLNNEAPGMSHVKATPVRWVSENLYEFLIGGCQKIVIRRQIRFEVFALSLSALLTASRSATSSTGVEAGFSTATSTSSFVAGGVGTTNSSVPHSQQHVALSKFSRPQ